MSRLRSRFRGSRLRGDGGATLVEAALVTPLFFVTVLSLFELSFMAHNWLKVTGAAGDAVRAVTVAGSSPTSDFLAIRSLEHGLSSFDLQDVEVIVIYKADGPDDTVPPGCLSIPVPAGLDCNAYSAPDFFLSYVDAGGIPTGHWGCGPLARDDAWCPTNRQASLSEPGGPDYVGVYIELEQRNITGMFDWDRTLEVNRVARIEPVSN